MIRFQEADGGSLPKGDISVFGGVWALVVRERLGRKLAIRQGPVEVLVADPAVFPGRATGFMELSGAGKRSATDGDGAFASLRPRADKAGGA